MTSSTLSWDNLRRFLEGPDWRVIHVDGRAESFDGQRLVESLVHAGVPVVQAITFYRDFLERGARRLNGDQIRLSDVTSLITNLLMECRKCKQRLQSFAVRKHLFRSSVFPQCAAVRGCFGRDAARIVGARSHADFLGLQRPRPAPPFRMASDNAFHANALSGGDCRERHLQVTGLLAYRQCPMVTKVM